MNLLQGVLVTGGALAGTFLAALYAFQEKILYHPTIPTREYEKDPADFGLEYDDVDILTEDRVKIHAWLIKQPNPKDAATFLYFHGNAGNLSHRLPDVRYFIQSGYNVLMVSYRGYGRSEGSPTEKGIKLDALAALEYALDRNDTLDTNRVYIFGRSIGAACAIALATTPLARQSVRGLVVENTFTSIDDMIDHVMPVLSFAKPFNRNKWNSRKCIQDIEVPILFISGLRDELCPPQHMKELHELAVKARFRVMHIVLTGSHNDTWWAGGPLYRTAIREFTQRVESGE